MFKLKTIRVQLQEERALRRTTEAKVNAISKDVELETEEGVQIVTEPLLKEDTEVLRDYMLDVDYRLILQELGLGGM